jgi:hypothetical protein
MKEALDRLKTLIDGEERLAVAITYGTTQQTAQTTGRTEQKIESITRTIEEIKATQQSKQSRMPMVTF